MQLDHNLTLAPHKYNNPTLSASGVLSMRGYIETYQKCSNCGQSFKRDDKKGLSCKSCHSVPTRFRIVIFQDNERHIISKDIHGKILDSYQRAERLLTNMRTAIDEGTFDINNYLYHEIQKFFGSHLIPLWMQIKKQQNLSPLYLDKIEDLNKKYLKPFFESIDCRLIKTFHIEDFFMSLPSTWHDKTKKNAMTTLHSFVTWLFRREVLPKMPSFPVISPPEPVIDWIDRETQLKVIAPMPAHLKELFGFMFHHPIRIGEVCALKKKDVDIEKGIILICRAVSKGELRSRKNKKPYHLPLWSGFKTDLLKDKLPEAFVFTNRYGRPHAPNVLRKNWNKYCRLAGVKVSLKNGTRHSGASQARNRGIDLSVISKALGHSSLQVTARHYADLNVEHLRKVTEG